MSSDVSPRILLPFVLLLCTLLPGVSAAGQPPVAEFLVSPDMPRASELVKFLDKSTDPDGDLVAWHWDFGDGTTSNDRNATHTYATPSTYHVKLRVTDSEGNARDRVRDVNVQPARGPLQTLVGKAPNGGTITFPAGSYEEAVVVERDLTIYAEGEVKIFGGPKPAITVKSGDVRLHDLSLSAANTALALHDSPRVELWNLTLDAPTPLKTNNVALILLVVPPDEDPAWPPLVDTTIVHAHPVQLRFLRSDGSPYAEAKVRLFDNEHLAFEGTTNSKGALPFLPIAHKWATSQLSGTNTTKAYVPATNESFLIDPHANHLEIQTQAPPAKLPLWQSPVVVASTVAVVTTGVGLASLFRFHQGFRWRWLLLFAPFYTRFHRGQILEHGVRETIYGYVEENPGAHLRGIKRGLSLHHGTLLHHLQMLESHGYLKSVRDGMYRRYFVTGAAPRFEGQEILAAQVEQFLKDHPGATNAQVAQALAKRPSLTYYHVQRLEQAGRVRKERDGREVRLYFQARFASAAPREGWLVPPDSGG